MKKDSKTNPLPFPTIRRYPIYLRAIKARIARGEFRVSSAALAEELKFDPVLTRKDLAMSGMSGRPRLGYPAMALCDAINRALGWDSETDAVLVGVGSLGSALLGYTGFEEQNLSIAAAFDNNNAIIGDTIHGVKVHPMEEMPKLVAGLKVKIGILTVPTFAAQTCANELIKSGIKGILNFCPVMLDAPSYVTVQNVDLAQSLAVLSHVIAKKEAVRKAHSNL
ncbi:MAG: redox-sensing transcriptional repressor Rex [Kiritimatiellae bacterium]|nr:redox-sensing transcriptional repressor Rex [Kiritimatiellia bacterium]